jgi:hypothetical protein
MSVVSDETQTVAVDSQVPTGFQERARRHAEAAANWMARSYEPSAGGLGSAIFYSRIWHPLRGWGAPYPETTGYMIPTLLRYARFARRPEFTALGLKQADWVLTLQYADGALPGGVAVPGKDPGPSIFNTGQMIKGLVAAWDETSDRKYLEAATRAAEWLAREVDESAGIWTTHAYKPGYSPAYYSRVCWPMLEVHQRQANSLVKSAALGVLQTIIGWQLENGAIRNWAFEADKPAFTHTIAYTIRGLLESARILESEGDEIWAVGQRAADVIRRRAELRRGLAGAYDLDLNGRHWYTCLTGNCQMALVWMKVYRRERDARFLSAALKALEFVMDKQRMRGNPRGPLHGAVAGSSPVWGRYITMRYPNWSAKFLTDGIMEADELISALVEGGPCASS